MTTDTSLFSEACSSCGCSTTYEATGTVVEADDTVELVLSGNASTIGLQITGTWAGTLKVEGTIDGTNYIDLNLFSQPGNVLQVDVIANGAWQANVAGYSKARVRGHSDFSGEAAVTIRATSGPGLLGDNFQVSLVPSPAQVVWTKTAFTLTGNVSETMLAASAARKAFFVFNPFGNDPIYVDVSGGNAAVGGRKVIAEYDWGKDAQLGPTNEVTVVGVNGQTIYVYTAA